MDTLLMKIKASFEAYRPPEWVFSNPEPDFPSQTTSASYEPYRSHRRRRDYSSFSCDKGLCEAPPSSLRVAMRKNSPSFFDILSKYIDRTGLKDSDIYNRAMIDRSTFSRMRTGYIPNRKSVLRLTVALQLTQRNGKKLVNAAGYSFGRYDKFDKFILWCLQEFSNGVYHSWTDLNEWCYECTGTPLEGED